MSTITEYNKISHNGEHYKTEFVLRNTPVYIANSLRRSFSSMVPTVTFDDTYYDDILSRSIRIHKNTSPLHNEFFSHRITLVPINSENRELLIESSFNKDGSRTFKFVDGKLMFKLNKKNNKAMATFRDKMGLINVKSSDFVVENDRGEILDTSAFFPVDVFTGDSILLNKLKQDLGDEDGGEEIKIDCVPQINMGRFSTKNDPTGTVTYEMIVDETRVDTVFEQKKDYLNAERIKKGLPEFSADEISQLRTSFDLLDKDRVVQTDSSGNPNIFKFSVESIGFMNPDSIINCGLSMLIISLKDIQNSFTFDDKTYDFSYNEKIEMSQLDSTNVNTGWIIKVINENHTIGNLLSNVIRNIWCEEGTYLDYPVLKMAAYKMHHPTIEEIEFVMVPKDISKTEKIDIINKLYSSPPYQGLNENHLGNMDNDEVDKVLCALLFQKAINCCIELLLNIKSSDSLKDLPLVFNVNDTDDWMTKNTNINGIINNDSIHLDRIYYMKSVLNIDKQIQPKPTLVVQESQSQDTSSDQDDRSHDSDPVSPDYKAVDTPPYVPSSTKQDDASYKSDGEVSDDDLAVSSEVEESIIPGISKIVYLDNLAELMESGAKNKIRFEKILEKLYTDGVEKQTIEVSQLDSIIDMIKSPSTAVNKDPLSGSKLDIVFTKQKHETDEKKSIVKGIRVDYEKKNIASFKKTITFKKKN